MSTSFITLQPGNTVAQALAAIRAHERNRRTRPRDDVYVAEEASAPCWGRSPSCALAFADPARPLSDLYERKIVSVTPQDTQNDAARRMAKYDVHALPVVDAEGALVGMIAID